jgi:hypothetical protein
MKQPARYVPGRYVPGRYVLALTLVASTLCAGRLIQSDKTSPSEQRPVVERLVARLTRTLSRSIARSPLVLQRRMVSPVASPRLPVSTNRDFSVPLLMRESRLPPPVL